MPNLLKSLPREILEKEDSKFIYNVLNPLLFDKVKEQLSDTIVTHKVSALLNKDINFSNQFLDEFTIPYNVNSREFNVYMTDEQENLKLEYFGSTELVKDLDDLKDFVFFYFGLKEYSFLYDLMKSYYSIKNEFEKSKNNYEINYKKYISEPDLRKKKIYKSSFEFFKKTFDEYDKIKKEFDIVFDTISKYSDYSHLQLVDNIAKSLGDFYKIKTFDNEIIFEKSILLPYLNETLKIENPVKRHIFSGKKIISTNEFSITDAFELISVFAMEITAIKVKYDNYLKMLIDNGNGYSLQLSSFKKIKNEIVHSVNMDLQSDNLTYMLDEENNKLDIYVYFSQTYRIDESTFSLHINEKKINKSIQSMKGYFNHGYSFFEYFDETTKYYKITVHDFLTYDTDGECENPNIDSIVLVFDIVNSMHNEPDNIGILHLETTGFLDNFNLYGKNEQTGFYELLHVPYKLKISIDERDERFLRLYEFVGLNASAQMKLQSYKHIIISYFSFDYVYEPKIYVDFFKYYSNEVKFRFNTIVPYVLIDDVYDDPIELDYFAPLDVNEHNLNCNKNSLMFDGKTYRKLYDEIHNMRILNPYEESGYEFVSKISFSMLKERPHSSRLLIDQQVDKIGFKKNLQMFEKLQIDFERNAIILMHRGIQKCIPVNEGLNRGLNLELFDLDHEAFKIRFGGCDVCSTNFVFSEQDIYVLNTITMEYNIVEASATEQINLTGVEYKIFFDIHEMAHCIVMDSIKYKVDGLYIDSYLNAQKIDDSVLFIESKYGIPRYKSSGKNGVIFDVDFSKIVLKQKKVIPHRIIFDGEHLIYSNGFEIYTMNISKLEAKKAKHRQLGISAYSIFYAGNVLPEHSNKTFIGRENIFNSMFMTDSIYDIGKSADKYNDSQQHHLLAEQMDLDNTDAAKFNLEEEQYLMFKSKTSSFKGLESYLVSSLKVISDKVKISPVYLIQRNRFISEWAKVSSVQPDSYYAENTLKELVADLMETKLLNGNYDDLMDIFKNNDYEKFSIDTNNIHDILIQYILRFLDNEKLLENFTYYLIHEIWIKKTKKKMMDFLREHSDAAIIREISEMKFETSYDSERFFYLFVNTLFSLKKEVIKSYIPIANYSDWNLYLANNATNFEKKYHYEVIDISEFVTMPIEWGQPLYMIRPLTEDHVFVKRDFRFLDLSILTNSQVAFADSYNEYAENIKNKLNRPVNYIQETLSVLNELSIKEGFDILSVNLVILKWVVERFLPNYLTNNVVETVDEFRNVIVTELSSAEHPNFIVEYNKIKESILLGDLGENITQIFESIVSGNLLQSNVIRLNVTSVVELEYLDKIKKPLEHYFDYLFFAKRHDLITKILALFTEDVIASSMLDLSLAINLKNSKGDETFTIYEKMIFDIFDEYLPFHSVLDKIIFVFNVMESRSSQAIGKELAANVLDHHMIDVMSAFVEKVKIQTFDKGFFSSLFYFPSEGMRLCGAGYDDQPYDYDRMIKSVGYGEGPFMDDTELYGMDDESYVMDRSKKMYHRVSDLENPPYFAEYIGECVPAEKIMETSIADYYKIRIETFANSADKIMSHFVDTLPSIGIMSEINEVPIIDVVEDYLIHIDSTFKIRFFDYYEKGHDSFGYGLVEEPEGQISIVGMHDSMRQNILHDFYDKLNISLLDSIWSDIVVIYDVFDIPGHDEFGIDENYHQRSPYKLDCEISTMVYDKLIHDISNSTFTDMSDVSLVNEKLATKIFIDYNKLKLNAIVADGYHMTIGVIMNRTFDADGHFLRPGHDEFLYDEYYHNSVDDERANNMADVMVSDFEGHVRIDFGFMRMLPFDPYAELIDLKFYRRNLPGSELEHALIRDKFLANIHTFGKDIIRISFMDFYTLDTLTNDVRRKVYSMLEDDTSTNDVSFSVISDSLVFEHYHHDFRENIVAIDKFATILNDSDIINIYGVKAAEVERDELFKIEFMESYFASIKIKQSVERSMTKIDKDYLQMIKVEEENFVSFKYVERDVTVRFFEILHNYVSFKNLLTIELADNDKQLIKQLDVENTALTGILDRVSYGQMYIFEIDGMQISTGEKLLGAWSNAIHKDSSILTITDNNVVDLSFDEARLFEERTTQFHDLYGHMGYSDESLDRSIESRLKDTLLQISAETYFDTLTSKLYDGLMTDVGNYYGDYIDVVISDSLKTYVDIVKKPWIFPEFDDFGHNMQPHMYNGDSEEFDITTVLRETLKLYAYCNVYESNILATLFERINVGYLTDVGVDTISVSMCDDLKYIWDSLNLKDSLNIGIGDTVITRHNFRENKLVTIYDRVWYGYKLQEPWLEVSTKDSVYYGYFDKDILKDSTAKTTVRDWLLVEYLFIDDKPNIVTHDKLEYSSFGNTIEETVNTTLRDSVVWAESINYVLFENTKINISDRLVFGSESAKTVDIFEKDVVSVSTNEVKFMYGPGKKFGDKLNIFTLEKFNFGFGNPDSFIEDVPEIEIVDEFCLKIHSTFNEKVELDLYERMKFGPIFKDKLHIVSNDLFGTKTEFLNRRYGVDFLAHDDIEMEYYDGSYDRSFNAGILDDIMVIDIHRTFSEKLKSIIIDTIVFGNEYEQPDISSISNETIGAAFSESFDIRLSWLDERFGVDGFKHDDYGMEYFADSIDRSITTSAKDDIKITEIHLSFFEIIDIVSTDALITTFRNAGGTNLTFSFSDSVRGLLSEERFTTGLLWTSDRIGVDAVAHNEFEMGYYGDSLTREITSDIYDEIKIIDTHMTFGESLIILSTDQLSTSGSELFVSNFKEGIIITSNDDLQYGFGVYDYVWDSKEWEKFGYSVPYEMYAGSIPHDDFPYDSLAHAQQGENVSQVTTGLIENVVYEFNLLFKDNLVVSQTDESKPLEYWEYRSLFKDNMNIATSSNVNIGSFTGTDLRKETILTNSYTFNDDIKITRTTVNEVDEVSVCDDIKIIDTTLTFTDSLSALVGDSTDFRILFDMNDGVRIFNTDSITYGAGLEFPVWNSEDWKSAFKNESIDSYIGKIPHDEIPYDELEHNEQGSNLSVVSVSGFETLHQWFEFKFKEHVKTAVVEDSIVTDLNVTVMDSVNCNFIENVNVGLIWLNDRFSVDSFEHDFGEMEYLNDSIDRTITVGGVDDIKLIDIHRTFSESLIIMSSDQLESKNALSDGLISTTIEKDGIVLLAKDTLMYGPGRYDYIWDAKEWNSFGYELPYESWVGKIPHDDFPYDSMEHDEQGNDLSVVGTITKENVVFDFGLIFRDTLSISLLDATKIKVDMVNFYDYVRVSTSETFITNLVWPTHRYGVDAFSHDEKAMDYSDNAIDRTVSTTTTDHLLNIDLKFLFNEKLSILSRDNILVRTEMSMFGDSIRVVLKENLDVGLVWPDSRFGVDHFSHDSNEMEYYDGSADRLVTASLLDDIKIIDVKLSFTDNLTIQSDDRLTYGEHIDSGIESLVITTKDDTLTYGLGFYDFVWDNKAWDQMGYSVPYEMWKGGIPHDAFPYDAMEHIEQGNDLSSVVTEIKESMSFVFDLAFKEKLNLITSEKLVNSTTALFGDSVRILNSERIGVGLAWLDDRYALDSIPHDEFEMGYFGDSEDRSVSVGLFEHVKIVEIKLKFNERTNIIMSDKNILGEKIKGTDLILKYSDKINVRFNDNVKTGLAWLDDRYALDSIPHDEFEMGYFGGSEGRSISTSLIDGIMIIDTHLTFGESLIIQSNDQINIGDNDSTFFERKNNDGIIISSNDTLMYGVGSYDYIWDAKEWNNYGYSVPYENWRGIIPHDEIPHDFLEHDAQGSDFSIIGTTTKENLSYGLSLNFKETLNTVLGEKIIKGVNFTFVKETLGSIIKDSMIYGLAWLDERFGVDTQPHDSSYHEYFGESSDRSITTELFDDLTLLDLHLVFKDRLNVTLNDSIVMDIETSKENIKIITKEKLNYGFGIVNCLWDAAKWSDIGISHPSEDDYNKYASWYGLTPHGEFPHDILEYDERFEEDSYDYMSGYNPSSPEVYSLWHGHIPHDATPYDYNEHGEQGNDVSIIDTLIKENLVYGYKFSENIKVAVGEQLFESTTNFWEEVKILSTDAFNTLLKTVEQIHRFGVDEILHDSQELEYFGDSLDRSLTTALFDDFKVLDIKFNYTEKLSIVPVENLQTTVFSDLGLDSRISIVTADSGFEIGFGYYNYAWNSYAWEEILKENQYDAWRGKIPHDAFPYDAMEHDEQGDASSIISTGIFDEITYNVDLTFKESLVASLQHSWIDKHRFNEYSTIYASNRLEFYEGESEDVNMTDIFFRNESLSVSYDFNDSVKTHKFLYSTNGPVEEIEIRDRNTQQLIETIIKYRMYEKIDIQINEDILSSTLFKYDEELSLVTDFKTRIDLYRQNDSGQITKSMTVIKDNTSAKIELYFIEGLMASMVESMYHD